MGLVATYLTPTERLTAVTKEKWTKKSSGSDVAYIVQDRLGHWQFIGQKLPYIRAAINEHATRDEPWARVSVNGLWESVDREDGRVGPFVKGRWKVRKADLHDAREMFERGRARHEMAIVVGNPDCYAVNGRAI
jgi:hypothetical protein